MAGQIKRLAGPAYIASSATDVLAAPATGYYKIFNIHIVNKDSTARTFSLYLGATGGFAGGTEIGGGTRSIPANTTIDIPFYGGLVQDSTKYLSGIASSASTLVITVTGEHCISSS